MQIRGCVSFVSFVSFVVKCSTADACQAPFSSISPELIHPTRNSLRPNWRVFLPHQSYWK